MAKNLIPGIARILGVEIGEEFTIKENGEVLKVKYKFSKENLLILFNKATNDWRVSPYIRQLVTGEAEVVKLPYRPERGEKYYTCVIRGGRMDKWQVNSTLWFDSPTDYARQKCGIVYRTKEEAKAALPAKYEELTGRKWSGENEEY